MTTPKPEEWTQRIEELREHAAYCKAQWESKDLNMDPGVMPSFIGRMFYEVYRKELELIAAYESLSRREQEHLEEVERIIRRYHELSNENDFRKQAQRTHAEEIRKARKQGFSAGVAFMDDIVSHGSFEDHRNWVQRAKKFAAELYRAPSPPTDTAA